MTEKPRINFSGNMKIKANDGILINDDESSWFLKATLDFDIEQTFKIFTKYYLDEALDETDDEISIAELFHRWLISHYYCVKGYKHQLDIPYGDVDYNMECKEGITHD